MTEARLWWARLAPLGVPTTDGRVLDAAGKFTLHRGSHVFLIVIGDGKVTPADHGSVTYLGVADGWLVGSGTVWNTDTIRRMAAGEVFPELSLTGTTGRRTPTLKIITSGTVGAVAAGRAPAWPGARFVLEES